MTYVEVTSHKILLVGKFYLQGTLGLVYIEMCNTGARVVRLAS